MVTKTKMIPASRPNEEEKHSRTPAHPEPLLCLSKEPDSFSPQSLLL